MKHFLLDELKNLQIPVVVDKTKQIPVASLHLILTRAHSREFSIAYSAADKAKVKTYVDQLIQAMEKDGTIKIIGTIAYGIGHLTADEMDRYYGPPQQLSNRSFFAGKANRVQSKRP